MLLLVRFVMFVIYFSFSDEGTQSVVVLSYCAET